MTATRQDAWSPDDDLLLAEVTLRHIREGSTQLAAFEEVSQKLGRTAAACGFRWNSTVRKKYEAAIQIAKAQRQKKKQSSSGRNKKSETPDTTSTASASASAPTRTETEVSFDAVIRFLRQQKEEYNRLRKLEAELEQKEKEIARLREENDKMKEELDQVQSEHREINDDYKTLIRIMDRARKLAVLSEEEDPDDRTRFKMDPNGNLERVDK
ncbi:MAG: RsfA family transcriptional regulator [Bacillaceae bacterium]|nr:RsfA family transcriptional regulator [Bacillaceae bacterium]